MKGFIIGFSLSLFQALYCDYIRSINNEKFNKKMILYLKEKEKNLT
jgi:hypothetical protein